MQHKHKENESVTISKPIDVIVTSRVFMLVLVIIGVLIYILTLYCNDLYISKGTGMPFTVKICLNILTILSGTFISTGILSLFLRITSIRKDMQETVLNTYKKFSGEILKCDYTLDTYNDEILEDFKRKIVIQQLGASTLHESDLSDTVYSLENGLMQLLKGLYYEYHDMTVVLIPDRKANSFKKRVTLEYKVVNLSRIKNKLEYQIGFYKNTEMLQDSIDFTLFQIDQDKLAKDEIDACTKIDVVEVNGDSYHYLTLQKELGDSAEHTIALKYEYNIPSEDRTHSFKLPLPCKKLNHNVIISGNESMDWNLEVNAFTSWFHVSSPMEKEFRVTFQTKQNSDIRFSNWSLPGAGYVVSISKEI